MKIISPNLKFFLAGFIFSLPFFWGANLGQKNLEDFLFWKGMAANPQLLTAQMVQDENFEKMKPIRNLQVENLEIQARGAISVFIDSSGSQRIIFDKESDEILPIASLTKLMTANVVLDNLDLSQIIRITKKAVDEEGAWGNFKAGEIFPVKSLLYSLLMESSNDAAIALAETTGESALIDLMNLTAANLGLKNTHFVNLTGLDPDKPEGSINYSTAENLAKLTAYLSKAKPLILEITGTREFFLYSPNGVFHHQIENTNELLKESASWRTAIIGGKTGWTPESQGCLIIIMKSPENPGKIINVILGSPDRFGEMKKLIDWLNSAYKW